MAGRAGLSLADLPICLSSWATWREGWPGWVRRAARGKAYRMAPSARDVPGAGGDPAGGGLLLEP